MPIGSFLDSFPTLLFVIVHIVFLVVGLWAFKQANDDKMAYAPAFLLYALSQVAFLGFFGGVLTMKMAVLIEQTLMVVLVAWVALGTNAWKKAPATS